MNNIDDDIKREYKGIIPIESLMTRQIDRAMEYGSQRKIGSYMDSIDLLIDLLPPEIEGKALEYKKEHSVFYKENEDGKLRYRALFRYIKQLLAEGNIVWKKSSYEVGSENK